MSITGAFRTLKNAFSTARRNQQTLDGAREMGRLEGAANYLGKMGGGGVNALSDGGRAVVNLVGGSRRAAALGGGASIVVFLVFVVVMRSYGVL